MSTEGRLPAVAVRVISLPGSPRRDGMARQLDAIGLDWRFFDALTQPPPDIPHDPRRVLHAMGRPMSQGELGCFASHRALWREMAESPPARLMLVLEDDLLLDPHFFARMDDVAAAAERYPYLRLYAMLPGHLHPEDAFLERYVGRFTGRTYGTQAYFLRQDGASRLIESIRSVARPVDKELDRYWAHGLPIRAVFPFPVLELDNGSQIGLGRYDRQPLSPADSLAHRLTQVSERLRRLPAAALGRAAATARWMSRREQAWRRRLR